MRNFNSLPNIELEPLPPVKAEKGLTRDPKKSAAGMILVGMTDNHIPENALVSSYFLRKGQDCIWGNGWFKIANLRNHLKLPYTPLNSDILFNERKRQQGSPVTRSSCMI